jgi:hypothetical protein
MAYLSQSDPKWADFKIGNSQASLGDFGCLVTCISMLSDYFDCYQTPREIASHAEWFTHDGKLIWINSEFPTFSFRWREGNIITNTPARNDELIQAYLPNSDNHDERAALLAVAHNSHWVLPLAFDPHAGDYLAVDPADGMIIKVLEKYNAITASGHFIKWNDKSHKAWWRKGRPVAPYYE